MFGFASFASHDEAESCVTTLHGKEIDGKEIYAGRAQKKAERVQELKQQFFEKRQKEKGNKYQGVNLYVKNLDDTVTDDQLYEAFAVHGQITSAKVMCDGNGTSKGFGFVCYSNPEEATKAVTEMNGRIVGSKPLYVALAQRKEERKAHLQQQYLSRVTNGQNISRMSGLATQLPTNHQFGYPQMAPMPNYYIPQIPTSPRIMSPTMTGAMRMPYGGIPGAQHGHPHGHPRFAATTPASVRAGQMGQMNNPRSGMPGGGHGARAAPTQNYLPGNLMQQTRPPQMVMNQGIRQGAGGAYQQAPVMGQPGQTGQPQVSPFKYNTQVRNPIPHTNNSPYGQNGGTGDQGVMPMQQQATAGQGGASQEQQPPQNADLTAEMLAKAEPSEQKQMLGERIYPLVADQVGQDQAGKVTGMLLEIENNELLMMVENREMLKERVKEACNVLQSHDSGKQKV
jgi:polyadenylate-binding protein